MYAGAHVCVRVKKVGSEYRKIQMRAKNKLKEKDRKREKQMEESKMGREVMHRWDGWTDEDGVDSGKKPFVLPPPPKDVALTGALVFV